MRPLSHVAQVVERVRQSGDLKGEVWQTFKDLPTGQKYPSKRKGMEAGFVLAENVD